MGNLFSNSMKKMVKKILCLFILFLASDVVMGQENFESWVDDKSFILSRTVDGSSKLFQIHLPSGRATSWEALIPQESYQSPLTLEDGSSINISERDLFLIKADGSEMRLTNDDDLEKNPRLSPDQSQVAYTKNHDLYVFDLATISEKRLTFDGSDHIYNGWASWVYYEEILGRPSRYAAFWWSPDNEHIAFLHFDDSPVPSFTISRSEGINGNVEVMRYPKSGDANPNVKLGIVNSRDMEVRWMEEDSTRDQYTAWPFWSPDGQCLLVQELNRSQDTLDIVRIDMITGARKNIYQQSHTSWVEFFEDITFISDREFILRSDKNGWYNLYRYDIEGNLLATISNVEWQIKNIEKVDVEANLIWFYGTGKNNADKHLFRASLDGQNFMQVTKESGTHDVIFAPNDRFLYDTYSSIVQPRTSAILDSKGEVVYELEIDRKNDNNTVGIRTEVISIPTEDGFMLPAIIVFPKNFEEGKKHPLVFRIYGGPNSERVFNRFSDYSSDFYANNGIISLFIDHRGCGKFGRKGSDFMHRSLGQWEINDYITAVKWLRQKGYVNHKKIGITGGSYGGYLTCMALTSGSEYFKYGVSLYPVTDWHLYDNVYTERYMDTPSENPEGYEKGSAIEQAYRYNGGLLLVHGAADDNVHMQNSMQFISKMQDLNNHFELMIYPGERHGWGGTKRKHLMKLVYDFWKRNLISDSSNQHEIRP